MKILYTALATATGEGRAGHVSSHDGVIDVDLGVPKELGGAGGEVTNPEQLFAAGYAGCFHNALRIACRRARKDVEGSQVTAEVGLGPIEGGRFGLAVTLAVALPNVAPEDVQDVVQKAHHICPYSNALRGNVEVQLRVV